MNSFFFITVILLFSNLGLANPLLEFSDKDLEKEWVNLKKDTVESTRLLIQFLESSSTGREIVELAAMKAKDSGKRLSAVISPGKGSITDTTLVRKFSTSNPEKISYLTKSHVYINRSLSAYDAVLDLAHELTHYIYRSGFNPYSGKFNLKDFIATTIEGKGGEVDAFMMECKVLFELFPRKFRQNSNCFAIYENDQVGFSRELAVKRFYQVGSFYSLFKSHLEKHQLGNDAFPHANDEPAAFISSAYGLPYPVASLHEYESILNKVCQNDHRRLSHLKNKMGSSLSANEVAQAEVQVSYMQLIQDYQRRCDGRTSLVDN